MKSVSPYFDTRRTGRNGAKLALNDEGRDLIRKLAAMGCTRNEVYAFMGVSHSTFNVEPMKSDFEAAYENGLQMQKVSIRQAQHRCLKKDNPAVVIFMSKAVLGMTDGSEAIAPDTSALTDFLSRLTQEVADDGTPKKDE